MQKDDLTFIVYQDKYFNSKDLKERYDILKYLIFHLPSNAKDFFYKAFKKERYLDMKLCAVRGYAVYAAEEEVEVLMNKLLELLIKIPSHTPYDYSEYETMRSKFLMPYLLKIYNYDCFQRFNQQLEQQYNAMPDVFKDIFSCDEFGNVYFIRNHEEVEKSWDEFWADTNF